MSAPFDLSIETLDAWCERLYGCNPLTENEVMQLCNKVRTYLRSVHQHRCG